MRLQIHSISSNEKYVWLTDNFGIGIGLNEDERQRRENYVIRGIVCQLRGKVPRSRSLE